MYIEDTEGYYTADGTQHVRRALFLILFMEAENHTANPPIRALVRKVALRQVGNWMMGKARVPRQTVPLSGAYGADGLTRDAPPDIWARAYSLPEGLRKAWANGGGHNTAGSEAESMRDWALANLDNLTGGRIAPR